MAPLIPRPVPAAADERHRCPRGRRCASSSRDAEGEWHPALVNGAFCPADEAVIAAALPPLPRSYGLLALRIGDPVRSGRAVRRPPGSRVLVSPEADALLRTSAAVLMGWAARVRAVPGLSLSPSRHLPDSPEGVRDNCGILARHVTPLLALPPGPVTRTRTWAPGAWRSLAAFDRGTCRRCGLPVSRPRRPGARWLTAVPGPGCEHEAAPVPDLELLLPPEIEAEIGDAEAVHAGDGWATVVTEMSGVDAGLEILDLAAKFRRILGENPAPPDLLDGIPCRSCPAMSSLEVLPAPPPDPAKPEPPFCRCTVPSCRDEMTRTEYDKWVRLYRAWTRGAGVLTCRRCEVAAGEHECLWEGCTCTAQGHRRAA